MCLFKLILAKNILTSFIGTQMLDVEGERWNEELKLEINTFCYVSLFTEHKGRILSHFIIFIAETVYGG